MFFACIDGWGRGLYRCAKLLIFYFLPVVPETPHSTARLRLEESCIFWTLGVWRARFAQVSCLFSCWLRRHCPRILVMPSLKAVIRIELAWGDRCLGCKPYGWSVTWKRISGSRRGLSNLTVHVAGCTRIRSVIAGGVTAGGVTAGAEDLLELDRDTYVLEVLILEYIDFRRRPSWAHSLEFL